MRRQKTDHTERWQAIAYVLAAALTITNALWFYNWRVRAVEHHKAITTAQQREPETVVVYQERTERQASQRPARLADDERCMAGQVLRKIPNGWAGTGRRC